MFDIGASELLLTVVVAIVVIGPKDLPRALRLAGGWIAKVRRVSGHFRSGIEEMIRQAELEEMQKKWQEQNEAIMREAAIQPALASVEGASSHQSAADDHVAYADPTPEQPAAFPSPPDLTGQDRIPETSSPELPLAPSAPKP